MIFHRSLCLLVVYSAPKTLKTLFQGHRPVEDVHSAARKGSPAPWKPSLLQSQHVITYLAMAHNPSGVWSLQRSENYQAARTCVLQSRFLEGAYIGYYKGEHYSGYLGGYEEFRP